VCEWLRRERNRADDGRQVSAWVGNCFSFRVTCSAKAAVRRWNYAVLECRLFSHTTRTKIVNQCNDEHATRRQVNGGEFGRRAESPSLKDVSSCNQAWSDTQIHISVLCNTGGSGKHCCGVVSGRAFLRVLWRGQASRKVSSLARCVSVSLRGRTTGRLTGSEKKFCGTAETSPRYE
jgi:hypothetical protein